jgi:hypothetical protein
MARMKNLATGIRQMPAPTSADRIPAIMAPRPPHGYPQHVGEYLPENPNARRAATGARRTENPA